MDLLEMIWEEMKSCGNDVHVAIEKVAKSTGETREFLLEIYDTYCINGPLADLD